GRPADERDAAVDWLRDELADLMEHCVATIREAAQSAGYSWRTVQRASGELRVIVHRATFGGGYIWRLPRPGRGPSDESPDHACHHARHVPEKQNIGTHGTHDENPTKTDDPACQN